MSTTNRDKILVFRLNPSLKFTHKQNVNGKKKNSVCFSKKESKTASLVEKKNNKEIITR